MTVSSGFFNSVNHDRLYDAEQLSSIFDGVIVDGVYENVGEAFNVTAYPDAYNTVLVGTGRAWFDHTWTLNDSRFSITLDPPNEMLGRIDAIVIDVNKERDTRKNSIIYLKGDEATPDFPPTLINTENHHQYPIAYITRHAEQNGPISQSDIEITVGTGACPIATGVLEAQNLENLMQQLDSEFNEWWEGIKAVLDENVATNLQNQIDAINAKLDSNDALVGLLEKPIAEAFMSGDYGLDVTSYNVPLSFYYMDAHPIVTFLPNGECVSISMGYSSVYPDGGFRLIFNFYDSHGVSTSSYQVLNSTIIGEQASRILPHYSLLDYNIDSYPVKFYYALGTVSEYNNEATFTVATVQISSSRTVSVSYGTTSKKTFTDMYNGGIHVKHNSNNVKLSDGSIISPLFWNFSNRDETVHELRANVYHLTSDIVVGNEKYTAISTDSNFSEVSGNPTSFRYNLMSTDNIISYLRADISNTGYKDVGDRLIINPETLDVTFIYHQISEYPAPDKFQYKVAYEVREYNLSETGGVIVVKYEAGEPPSQVTEKRSNYYLGASNLGDPIPEGTLIASEDLSGRLYGIASSGEQIAIGLNGGAAILKTKKEVDSTVDISKSVLWLKGYYNSDDHTSYLFVNATGDIDTPYNYGSSGRDGDVSVSSAFVVTISKGV